MRGGSDQKQNNKTHFQVRDARAVTLVRDAAAPPASPVMRARETVTAGETEVNNIIRMQQLVYCLLYSFHLSKVKVEIESALNIYIIKLKFNLKC